MFLGQDASRPEAERALRFARRYSRKVEAIDTAELDLPGLDARYHGLMSPLVLSAIIPRLARWAIVLRPSGAGDRS